MANTLFFICVIFYIGRKNRRIFTGLILSIIDELLILVNTYQMKRQGSSISVYHAVQKLKMCNVVNVVPKLESHYSRSFTVRLKLSFHYVSMQYKNDIFRYRARAHMRDKKSDTPITKV